MSRSVFERNCLAFHDELPRVLQAPTAVMADEVAAASCRFVHIDASHLYEHVSADAGTSSTAIRAHPNDPTVLGMNRYAD